MAAPSGAAAKAPLSPQEAANVMLECIYEFNACVPYSGVSLVGAEGVDLDLQVYIPGLRQELTDTSWATADNPACSISTARRICQTW
jgi:hypothetical protein